MTDKAKQRVLIVDDDKGVRDTTAILLNETRGYEVSTAEHGFDALLQLRSGSLPDIIISDLNMPQMSGFEFLSVVRRRFPEIPVVAMSGAYESGSYVPSGVIADAFFTKSDPTHLLLHAVDELLQNSAAKSISHHRQPAPVWIPRNGKDSRGVPYIVLTCTVCLRSFPLSVAHEGVQEIQETPCLYCQTLVRYIIDFSLDVFSPRHAIEAAPGLGR